MKSRRLVYKNYVDKKIKIARAVFTLMFVVMFEIILYDSFVNNLPFHYILFFILGGLISLIFKKTQKIYWSKEDQKMVKKMNFFGILLLIVIIVVRNLLLPKFLRALNLVYISDALLLIAIGIFFGRIHTISKHIEEIVFSNFLEKHS